MCLLMLMVGDIRKNAETVYCSNDGRDGKETGTRTKETSLGFHSRDDKGDTERVSVKVTISS